MSYVLRNYQIYINEGQPGEELVKVGGLKVEYFVETLDSIEKVIHGEEVVKAILKDYSTGDVEYVKRRMG